MSSSTVYSNQSPLALEVIEVSYQYVGDTAAHRGKVAVLPPEYRWVLDLDILGDEVPQKWKEFNESISHYVDLALGESFHDLWRPSNGHGFYLTAIHVPCKTPIGAGSDALAKLASEAMGEYRQGMTEELDPDTL